MGGPLVRGLDLTARRMSSWELTVTQEEQAGEGPLVQVLNTLTWRMKCHPTPVSCLENPMDGAAWQATVHGVAKGWTRLSDFTLTQ